MLLEPELGFLRQIRIGSTIVLNGIYAAVRDENWNTIQPEIRNLKIHQEPGAFSLAFNAVCVDDDIHFVWNGTITGGADGKITYTFSGESLTGFAKNRIGFCVLHDATSAGHSCTVEHVDATITESRFPVHISAQQPFKSIRAITHELDNGVIARVRMEGDVFEMEDQRNWTDASYKTYCTPLDAPFPVELKPGNKIEQKITFEISDPTTLVDKQESGDVFRIELAGDSISEMPRLGLGMASHDIPLTDLETARLRALKLNHLRRNIRLFEDNWKSRFEDAVALAKVLEVRLHITLFLDDRGEEQLQRFFKSTDPSLIDAWLIFHAHEKSTDARWTKLARQLIGDSTALIVGGTNAGFTEINRSRPAPDSADAITWSVNPQVHAFDNLSLVETLDLQWETACSARQFFDGELMISPVTLRPRWNPDAACEPPPVPIDQLPPQVDPRQMSLFGSAWTLGSIASLSRRSLLRSITYYETTGWRGLMETSAGPNLAHLFVSRPRVVFPAYFVFALIAGYRHVRPLTRSNPARTTALLCSDDSESGNLRLLLANFHSQEIKVEIPREFTPHRQLLLEQTIAVNACRAPEDFLANGWKPSSARLVKLGPYALLAIDGQLV